MDSYEGIRSVVANSKVQHLAEGFRVSVTGDSIVVVREQPNEVLLEFVKMGPRKFKLNGHFVFPGYDIVATDNLLMVNTIQLSNNIFQNCSSAIGLG